MISALRDGRSLPPILVCGEIAYSGSHRIAAWDQLEIDPDVIELEDDEVATIMVKIGLEPGYDEVTDFERFEEFAKDLIG